MYRRCSYRDVITRLEAAFVIWYLMIPINPDICHPMFMQFDECKRYYTLHFSNEHMIDCTWNCGEYSSYRAAGCHLYCFLWEPLGHISFTSLRLLLHLTLSQSITSVVKVNTITGSIKMKRSDIHKAPHSVRDYMEYSGVCCLTYKFFNTKDRCTFSVTEIRSSQCASWNDILDHGRVAFLISVSKEVA